jgi:phosphoribosylaminoimidazole carboxylase (NCAIR synthetase)
VPGPLQVLENPWMQYAVVLPREVDDPDFTAFHPTSDAALRALGLETGLAHMEWFRTDDGRMLVNEVGARPPGANIVPLMSLAHDVDLWGLWARLMVKRSFAPPERRWAAGTCFFRGQGQGRVVAVHGLAEAQEEVGRYVVDVRLPVPGQPKATGYEGEGWAIVKAATTAEVVHALGRLVQTVRVELG